jgi:tetratricopeptide (TPR) repeat protein
MFFRPLEGVGMFRIFVASILWLFCSSIARASYDGEMTFTQYSYRQGWAAYFNGDLQEAGNWWHRYLALRKREPHFQPDFHFDRTLETYLTIKPLPILKPVQKVLPQSPVKKRKQKLAVKKVNEKTAPKKKSPAVSADQFLERAAREQQAGRYEQALELVDIALRLSPNDETATRKREQLRAFMESE